MQETKAKLIKALGAIIEKHRKITGKSIYLIAAESSMPKSTWRIIEAGKNTDINLTTFWKIAEGLDIPSENLIKELRETLGKNFTLSDVE